VGAVGKHDEGVAGVEDGENGVIGHPIDGLRAPAIERVNARTLDDGFDEFLRRELGILRIVRVKRVEDL
jgi:hypothetical protein